MMLIIATNASSVYFSLIFFMLNTSHIRLAYRTVEKKKENVSIEPTPYWSGKSWHLGSSFPDMGI